jgi:hypothetical protein
MPAKFVSIGYSGFRVQDVHVGWHILLMPTTKTTDNTVDANNKDNR